MIRLQIVGGGRMGEALLSGLLAGGWAAPSELAVVEALPARRDELAARFAEVAVAGSCVASEGTVVAVKPADVADACRAAVAAGTGRLLSIAAGVRLARLQESAGDGVAVVRAMPNTAALVGAGVAAIAAGRDAGEDDLAWAAGILGAVGTVVQVAEPLLDAVTGVSGSGPAYLFLVAEALIEGGVLAGLPRDVSTTLATHTVLGAGRLLTESGDSPEGLRAAVTSPGGTTAAGLRALEAAGVRAAILDAVTAATERSRQLDG